MKTSTADATPPASGRKSALINTLRFLTGGSDERSSSAAAAGIERHRTKQP
jgi:hypothetical protein